VTGFELESTRFYNPLTACELWSQHVERPSLATLGRVRRVPRASSRIQERDCILVTKDEDFHRLIVPEQVFGQLLIEEQSHDSGRRNTLRPAFAFCGVGETGPNVFRLQLREFFEKLSLIFPSREVSEDIAHGNPSPANARLPKPDRRIDADAIEKAHTKQFRAQAPNPPTPS
jgi:hypothetical protein